MTKREITERENPMNKNINLIGTLHTTHEVNPNYTYDDLKEVLKGIDPDILVIEMRQEDLQEPLSFLETVYPPEMVMAAAGNFGSAKVIGFDWRGQVLEGKKMSRDNGLPKVWELMEDDENLKKYIMERKALMEDFLTSCHFDECQKDPLCDKEVMIDQKIESHLASKGYNDINDYQHEREDKMCQNLSAIINAYPHHKIAIITGRAHLKRLKPYVESISL